MVKPTLKILRCSHQSVLQVTWHNDIKIYYYVSLEITALTIFLKSRIFNFYIEYQIQNKKDYSINV